MSEPTPQRLLRAHLAATAPRRELLQAWLYIGITGLAIIAVLALTPADQLTGSLHGQFYLMPVLGYFIALAVLLRRGWYHPAVPWVSAAVQASLLAIPYLAAARSVGAPFVAATGMYGGWLVAVSGLALKAAPRIAIAGGVLAAVEFLAISLAYGGNELTGYARSELFMKGVMFVLAGLAAGGIARYLTAQAHDALRAVREQDLMGKYFMHERLGAGGMAEVFRATYSPEGGFEKIVAVKRVLPAIAAAADGALFVEMFREEAKLCAQLSHPNIVQVLDAGKFRDSYVLTMEYVDGLPLHELMRRSGAPLPLAACTFVAAELAAALDYIHSRRGDVVHRDVNPPNVLISRFGEVKLADFGVAHAVNRASLDDKRIYGKLGYLAPEQLDDGPIDGRADLFALGITLYEMLVGVRLFRGASLFEVREFRTPEAELAGSRHGDALPAELRRLVVELLAPLPEDRPRTGGDVRARLLALTDAAAPLPNGPRALAEVVTTSFERMAAPPPSVATAETLPAKR